MNKNDTLDTQYLSLNMKVGERSSKRKLIVLTLVAMQVINTDWGYSNALKKGARMLPRDLEARSRVMTSLVFWFFKAFVFNLTKVATSPGPVNWKLMRFI